LFDTNSRFHQEQIARTSALLELSATTEVVVFTDSIDHLLAGLSSWSGDVYERGALDAIVLGGGLALIEDPALRRQIAEWSRTLDLVADVEADEENNIREYWLPFLQAKSYMPQIWNVGLERVPGWIAAEIPTWKTEDHVRLLRDPEFTNLVLIRQMTHEDIFHFHGQTTTQLSALVTALER
jgi:hypothetical protein